MTPATFGTPDDLTTCGFSPIGCNSRGFRHCWVTGLPGQPQRCAGLLAQWRRDGQAGFWQGRVVYAVDDDTGQAVLVEAWVPAEHLHPAGH